MIEVPKGQDIRRLKSAGLRMKRARLSRIQFDAPAVTSRLEPGGCSVQEGEEMNTRVCLISASLVFACLSAIGQEQAAKPKRPTIGLVLQGGGALGLAHVGVITWLEEHHIPVRLRRRHQHGRLGGRRLCHRPQCGEGSGGGERNQLGPGHGGPDALRRSVIPPKGGRPSIIPTAWNLDCVRECSFPRDSTPANRSH